MAAHAQEVGRLEVAVHGHTLAPVRSLELDDLMERGHASHQARDDGDAVDVRAKARDEQETRGARVPSSRTET